MISSNIQNHRLNKFAFNYSPITCSIEFHSHETGYLDRQYCFLNALIKKKCDHLT